jgi:hypothetical protein
VHREQIENDSLDSNTAPNGDDRRSHAAQLIYVRKLNRGLILSLLILASTLFTNYVFWDRLLEDRALDRYLDCVNFAAIGVDEPMCKKYEPLIQKNTNAYRRWDARKGEKKEIDQLRKEQRQDE